MYKFEMQPQDVMPGEQVKGFGYGFTAKADGRIYKEGEKPKLFKTNRWGDFVVRFLAPPETTLYVIQVNSEIVHYTLRVNDETSD